MNSEYLKKYTEKVLRDSLRQPKLSREDMIRQIKNHMKLEKKKPQR
ncbi:MAG: hypothetical protein DDT19_01909 [Syntrophomonadaceae bacterium]|nr:hypothetical protein [Bacillota bacterium]